MTRKDKIEAGIGIVLIFIAVYLALKFGTTYLTPDHYYVEQGESVVTQEWLALVGKESPEIRPLGSYTYEVRVLGIFKAKYATVHIIERRNVILSGKPMGIHMFSKGVRIITFEDILTDSQELVNPSKEAGILPGDIILECADIEINSSDDLRDVFENWNGERVNVLVERDGKAMDIEVLPVRSRGNGSPRLGVVIQNFDAGVGMISYIDPETKYFIGAGHAFHEDGTHDIIIPTGGEILDVSILSILKNDNFTLGRLVNDPRENQIIGTVLNNTERGLVGKLNKLPEEYELISIAHRYEVSTGPATLITTIDGKEPKAYNIEITRMYNNQELMRIEITDSELLDLTGGIVSGMSGSPIVKDGKLVGILSSVWRSKPTIGFAVFAIDSDTQLKLFTTA